MVASRSGRRTSEVVDATFAVIPSWGHAAAGVTG